MHSLVTVYTAQLLDHLQQLQSYCYNYEQLVTIVRHPPSRETADRAIFLWTHGLFWAAYDYVVKYSSVFVWKLGTLNEQGVEIC